MFFNLTEIAPSARLHFPSCPAPREPRPSITAVHVQKGQVTRAQEAEENYLVKRELSTVKQHTEELSVQLEQASNAILHLQQTQQPRAVRRAPGPPSHTPGAPTLRGPKEKRLSCVPPLSVCWGDRTSDRDCSLFCVEPVNQFARGIDYILCMVCGVAFANLMMVIKSVSIHGSQINM